MLGNKQKRAQYDTRGFAGFGDGSNGSPFEGFDFSDFNINFQQGGKEGGFGDFFSSIFSGMMNRGEDIQADIAISFEGCSIRNN